MRAASYQTIESPWRIEVTIESLERLKGNGNDFPLAFASVAFSGSVPSMQVKSCSLCGYSGRPVVESDPLKADRSRSDEFPWLSAKFSAEGPHLSVPLSIHQAGQLSSKERLAKSNRDCVVVKDDGSSNKDVVSKCTSPASKVITKSNDQTRGASLVWSSSDTFLPEIVELTIRISTDPLHVGVSHLVIFANHTEHGRYLMELPIKQPCLYQDEKAHSDAAFTSESRLRVRVEIPSLVTCASSQETSASSKQPSLKSSLAGSSSVSSSDSFLRMSRSELVDHVAPILEKITRHEREAAEYRESQKRAIDVDVGRGEGSARSKRTPERKVFSNQPFSWKRMIRSISSVGRCGIHDHVSIDSSIKTPDSWDI